MTSINNKNPSLQEDVSGNSTTSEKTVDEATSIERRQHDLRARKEGRKEKTCESPEQCLKRFRCYVESLDNYSRVAADTGLMTDTLTILEALFNEVESLEKKLASNPKPDLASMATQTEVQEVQEKPAAPQEDGEFIFQSRKGRVPKDVARERNSAKSVLPKIAPKSKEVQKQKPQQKEGNKPPKTPTITAPKSKPKPRASKPRPEAILVGSTEATSSAFRSNEELKEIGEKVTRVRRTQKAWTKGKSASHSCSRGPGPRRSNHTTRGGISAEGANRLRDSRHGYHDAKGSPRRHSNSPLPSTSDELGANLEGSEIEGPDRSNLCMKCGQPGHHRTKCPNAEKCLDCSGNQAR
uniref:CCHC-type domain-containing protein n=1 Tax=Anopheles dirus TaxID=7168 RepID=A0A182NGJ3_9DIPT